MADQLKMFEEYRERMKAIAGEERTASILSSSLYVVCAGTDDIANTYFTTPFRKPHYDMPSYVNLLVTGASTFLKVNSKIKDVFNYLTIYITYRRVFAIFFFVYSLSRDTKWSFLQRSYFALYILWLPK